MLPGKDSVRLELNILLMSCNSRDIVASVLLGMVGVVWLLGWLYFAYDSPDTHPRVSIREKRFIKQSLEHIDQKVCIEKCAYLSPPQRHPTKDW